MDGSQKIPQRWLEPLEANRRAYRRAPGIRSGLGAWVRHIRGANGPVDDPRAAELAILGAGKGATEIVRRLFSAGGLTAQLWRADAIDCAAIAHSNQH